MKRMPVLIVITAMAACLAIPRGTAAGAEKCRVELDAQNPGPVISPLLFGHNLEHTRRAIWQGISAEMVANRKFAAVENGLPGRWRGIDGGGRVSVDDAIAYAAGEA